MRQFRVYIRIKSLLVIPMATAKENGNTEAEFNQWTEMQCKERLFVVE